MPSDQEKVKPTYSLNLMITGPLEETAKKRTFPGVKIPISAHDINSFSEQELRAFGKTLAKLAVESGLLTDPIFLEQGYWGSVSLALVTDYHRGENSIGSHLIGGDYPGNKSRILINKVYESINQSE